MKYTDLILENLKKTGLKRVLIKVDPIFANKLDFSKATSYEGYVLHENAGTLKILVIPDGITLDDIPEEVIEFIANDGAPEASESDVWEQFKHYVLHVVSEIKGESDPLIGQIINACNIEDIKTFLKQGGFDDSDLNEIFANFIFNDEECQVTEARLRDYVAVGGKRAAKAVVSPKTYSGAVSNVASGIENIYNAPGRFAQGMHDVVVGGDITPLTGGVRNIANAVDRSTDNVAKVASSIKDDADKRQQNEIQKSLYQPVKFPPNGSLINVDLGEVDTPDLKVNTQAVASNRQNYQNGFVYDLKLRKPTPYVDTIKIVVSQGSGQAQTFYFKDKMPVNSPQGLGLNTSNYFAFNPVNRQWILSAQQPSAPELFSITRIMQLNPNARLEKGNVLQLQMGKYGKKNQYIVVADPNVQDDTVVLKKVS